MSTKLYVGNLPYEATESDLQALFDSIELDQIRRGVIKVEA